MRFKKQLMTMALATVLSLTTIIAPKSIAYAAGESTGDITNRVTSLADLSPTNPKNYTLVTAGINNVDNIMFLMDEYSSSHALLYSEYYDYDEYGELIFEYGSSDSYNKSDYITMELYKYNNGALTMEDSTDWDLGGTDEDYIYLEVDESLFNQSYLYIRAGVSDNKDATTYEDETLFKIKNPFYNNDDISGHWAEASIRDFITKGYVGGYSDGSFRPNNSITRAEFVTILNKTFSITTTSGKVFNDTKTHWAKNEIDKAVTNGVCNGKSATEFKPNDPITREEAAVMIANYKKLSDTNYDKINQFKDNGQVSNWAKNSVEGLIENGYMGGYSDGTFRPKGKITRAEAVVTLSRIK